MIHDPNSSTLKSRMLCAIMQGINENPNHDHVKLEIPILNTIKIREVDLISVKSVPRDKLFLKTKIGSKRHLKGGWSCRYKTY